MILPITVFLKSNNYKKESQDFKDLFLSHPNYPSLYAITDTFDLLGIENIAAQVPKEQLDALPVSFLAFFNNEIVLVNQSNDVILVENEKVGKRVISKNDFLKEWDGVVVAIEPNTETVGENKEFFSNKYSLLGALLLFILILQYQNFSVSFVLNVVLSLLGLFISVLIIDEKLNTTDGVISKVCSFSETTSCDSVIKSEDSKLTKWLDFSDLPILYFATSLVSVLLNQNLISTFNFFAVLSLPIVGYSIWLQKAKIKKWCVLCLGVASILILESILFFVSEMYFDFSYISSLLLGMVIVFSVWFFIKPILFAKTRLEKNNLELLKFKRNFSIFNGLQKNILEEEKLLFMPKITLGNSNAKVNLTLILSPSCGHCHTAFEEAVALMNSTGQKLSLSIFFNLNPDNGLNPYFSIAENLLQINKDFSNKIEEAISDWHLKKMDTEEWKAKWEQKDIQFDIEQNLRTQYEWCLANEFNYTPVKIVNNKLFPKEYELKELKYFLSELEEETELLLV